MKNIQEIIGSSLKRVGLDSIVTLAQLQKQWPHLLGPMIAANSSPLRIRGDQLIVWVSSSSWATELSLMKVGILEKIASTAQGSPFKDLRFVLKK